MTAAAANVDPAELERFGRLAARWWDPEGDSRPLHHLNPARLAYVNARRPLAGLKVLDVGCGGGLLSEAMAVAGAHVVALDLAEPLIQVARLHALETGVEVDYRLQSIEDLAAEQPEGFAVVTCMEMIEHVPDPAQLIRSCAALLAPGGQLFLSTLNRSLLSFLVAIVGAEYLARLLPPGTHDYARFLKPSEIARLLRQAGLELQDVQALHYEPLSGRAWTGGRPRVNYLLAASKP